MKSMLRNVQDGLLRYSCLMFVCPGCKSIKDRGTGLHMLPVNSDEKKPSWSWDGDLVKPTLTPSILTNLGNGGRCHSFLRDGVFQFLNDSTHELAGKHVEMLDLPDWVIKE